MGHLTKENLEHILAKRTTALRPRVFVETGLYRGDQLLVAVESGLFDVVLGIELFQEFVAHCRARVPGAVIIQGDSATELPSMAQKVSEPVFWCLDAHYCETKPPIPRSKFPLWDELIALRARPRRGDIVVVDDVHTFGKRREDLRFQSSVPEWEGITPGALCSFFGCPEGEVIGDGYVMYL